MLGEGIRFGIAGMFSTLVHTIVAMSAFGLAGMSTLGSNICGFTVALSVSYYLNTVWSFRKRPNKVYFQRFLIVNSVSFSCLVLISLVSDNMGWNPIAGILLVSVFIPLASFLSHKYWTYSD